MWAIVYVPSCCINIRSKLDYHHCPELRQLCIMKLINANSQYQSTECFVPFELPSVTLKISSHECDATFSSTISYMFHVEGT